MWGKHNAIDQHGLATGAFSLAGGPQVLPGGGAATRRGRQRHAAVRGGAIGPRDRGLGGTRVRFIDPGCGRRGNAAQCHAAGISCHDVAAEDSRYRSGALCPDELRARGGTNAATGTVATHSSSWPGLARPSTSVLDAGSKVVDGRHKAGHDDGVQVTFGRASLIPQRTLTDRAVLPINLSRVRERLIGGMAPIPPPRAAPGYRSNTASAPVHSPPTDPSGPASCHAPSPPA